MYGEPLGNGFARDSLYIDSKWLFILTLHVPTPILKMFQSIFNGSRINVFTARRWY